MACLEYGLSDRLRIVDHACWALFAAAMCPVEIQALPRVLSSGHILYC